MTNETTDSLRSDKVETATVNVAVYGTLREGFWNFDRFLKGRSKFIKDAFVPGFTLNGVSGVPHVVRDEANEKGVYVEIHEVPFDMLPMLDRLEGYNPDGDPARNTYTRITVDVEGTGAFMYILDRPSGSGFAYGERGSVASGMYENKTRAEVLAQRSQTAAPAASVR